MSHFVAKNHWEKTPFEVLFCCEILWKSHVSSMFYGKKTAKRLIGEALGMAGIPGSRATVPCPIPGWQGDWEIYGISTFQWEKKHPKWSPPTFDRFHGYLFKPPSKKKSRIAIAFIWMYQERKSVKLPKSWNPQPLRGTLCKCHFSVLEKWSNLTKLSLYAQTANKYPLVFGPPKNSPCRSSSNCLVDVQHTLVSILRGMG